MQTCESHFSLKMERRADSCQQTSEETVLDLSCEIHSQPLTQPMGTAQCKNRFYSKYSLYMILDRAEEITMSSLISELHIFQFINSPLIIEYSVFTENKENKNENSNLLRKPENEASLSRPYNESL